MNPHQAAALPLNNLLPTPQQPLITDTPSAPSLRTPAPRLKLQGGSTLHGTCRLAHTRQGQGQRPPEGANSWQAISQPGARPAALQGGGEARGGGGGAALDGGRSGKTSAPLATRSEGRMQEIRGGGVSRRPLARSCAKPRLPLSAATVCPFQAWFFSPPPLSWRLGK